jgi:CRISPR/Cas system CMR-associated protein Cmr5 small subunit
MNNNKLLFGSMLLAVTVFCGLQMLLTKANNAYAEWIIPSQLKEAYKNAQNHSSDSSTSIPAVRAQDHNPMTADAKDTSISYQE